MAEAADADNQDDDDDMDDWETKMKKAEAQQAKVDEIVQDALSKCVKPDHVPLTKIIAGNEKASKSGRALLLAQVQKEKDAAEKVAKKLGSENIGPGSIGLQAAISSFARRGTINAKKKQAHEKDTSEAADVIKMGRHMLK